MSAHESLSHDHSSDGHLGDDALIDALYGVAGPGAEEHMRLCMACAARWSDLQEKRGVIATPVNATPAAMADLRRNVFRRIEHPTLAEFVLGNPGSRRAAPALAGVAACVLAIAVLGHSSLRPAASTPPAAASAERSAPATVPAAASDTQLYSDMYAMEQSFEPSASASLGVLFEQPEGATGTEAQPALK
jgi:hypothetical protein